MQDSHYNSSAIYRPGFENRGFDSEESNHVRRNGDDSRMELTNRFSQAHFGNHGFELPMRLSSAVEPAVYEMDHLVTFDVGTKKGVLTHADAVRKLRQMEAASGIWTRRVLLSVDEKELVVSEKSSGEELESFPISRIVDPLSFTKSNIPNVFNNLVVFIVQKESWTHLPSTMNIFQCIGQPAEEVVGNIQAACMGKFPRSMPQSKLHSREPDVVLYAKPTKAQAMKPNGTGNPSSDVVVANRVMVLNHCFDDIESFVTKIQNSARILKEAKQRGTDADQLNLPPKREFVDCLQKFKLSLNLIVELKDILRNPSATECVHSIFAPLELIVNVCRDENGKPKFIESIISPLLTAETCRFLEDHLNADELRLWRSLGNSWIVSREVWSGPAPSPYVPKFREHSSSERSQTVNSHNETNSQSNAPEQNLTFHKVSKQNTRVNDENLEHEHFITAQQAFLDELQASKRRVCVVTQQRERNDIRELTVFVDELVELLDDSRNWWKIRNSRNELGYAPKTILRPYPGLPSGTPNNV